MKHPWSPRLFAEQAKKLGRSDGTVAAAISAARLIKSRDVDLPVAFTLSHLAYLAGVRPSSAYSYAARTWRTEPYRVFELKKRPKPGGHGPTRGFRTICVPEPELMRLQRWIAQNILSRAIPHPDSFAFFPDRGILKAAQRHCDCRWLVKVDIRGFFDGIGERRCYSVFRSLGYGALLSFELARICTRGPNLGDPAYRTRDGSGRPYPRGREGHLPQGAPTSPALANIAVSIMDTRLSALAAARAWNYTRYADDLAFSTQRESTKAAANRIVALAKSEINRLGLEPNETKTVIATPGTRRVVLGLLVDGATPRLPRAFRDNLDTHLHALTKHSIGPERHRASRGFASLIGMRRHIGGLLAFAHHVEPEYAAACYSRFNIVSWPL